MDLKTKNKRDRMVARYNKGFERFARECDRFRDSCNENNPDGLPVSSIALTVDGRHVGISIRHRAKRKA